MIQPLSRNLLCFCPILEELLCNLVSHTWKETLLLREETTERCAYIAARLAIHAKVVTLRKIIPIEKLFKKQSQSFLLEG